MTVAAIVQTIQGVYALTNTLTLDCYIGSSSNIARRIAGHVRELRRGKHENIRLQRAWRKYGEETFVPSVLEVVNDRTALLEREQVFLDTIKNKYNIATRADRPPRFDNSGMKLSDETRAKMSASQRALWGGPNNAAARARMAELSRKHTSARDNSHLLRPDVIAERASRLRGRRHSAERRAKTSAALLGIPKSSEHRAKISAWARTNIPLRDRLRRQAAKALRASVLANTGAKRSEEFCSNMREIKSAFWASAAGYRARQRISDGQKVHQASLSPEQRSENARRAAMATSPEERSRNARRAVNVRWGRR